MLSLSSMFVLSVVVVFCVYHVLLCFPCFFVKSNETTRVVILGCTKIN